MSNKDRRDNAIVVNESKFYVDVEHSEGLEQCKEMGLLETVMHGEREYFRLSQHGINIFATLLRAIGSIPKSS